MTPMNSELDLELAKIICPDLLDTLTPQECHVMHPEIPKIQALIDEQVKEAEEYWRTYYGVATADKTPDYSKLSLYQLKVLTDYHQKQLATLKDNLKDKGGE